MNSKNNWKICLPTHEQKLLLQASLLQGEDVLTAWQQWRATVDIECLDSESYYLLGLLYRNLSVHNVNDSHMAKLKGVYKSVWYANQLLFQKILAILHSFHNAGIDILVLKDVALVSHYYQDYGIRPLSALDFLVRPIDATTINLLKKLGWIPETKKQNQSISLSPAIIFRSESKRPLILHQRIFSKSFKENFHNIWSRAISTQISDVSARVLSPNEQFLHVCLHSLRWNSVPPIRWVADAMMIINSSAVEIDWSQLVTQAQQYRLVLPLKNMLMLLHEVLGANIPLSVLQNLQNLPASPFEQFEYHLFRVFQNLKSAIAL